MVFKTMLIVVLSFFFGIKKIPKKKRVEGMLFYILREEVGVSILLTRHQVLFLNVWPNVLGTLMFLVAS